MGEQIPLLSLRMNALKIKKVPSFVDDDDESTLDTLAVMTAQDSEYKCRDYLGRRKSSEPRRGSTRCVSAFETEEDTPDIVCREKMIEWSYRVAEHFRTNREIVAYAFSFLDRFMDRCNCDRTAFKLASMTSLYMATKIFNAKQISITSLSDLSRGEFDVKHISEMERIILETLDWKMNPPTAQSFIDHLCALIPSQDEDAVKAIYERATFLAELCIYDYKFVTEERQLVAVACILNAMEGLDEEHLHRTLPLRFIATMRSKLCVNIHLADVVRCQERLWFLYGCSEQLQHDDILPLHTRHQPQAESRPKVMANYSNSPVSVDGPYS